MHITGPVTPIPQEPPQPGEKWVTHYQSITGWKVCVMWMNPEGPFPEPWEVLKELGVNTDAVSFALALAYGQEHGLQYRPYNAGF